jgi:hypothetical protein
LGGGNEEERRGFCWRHLQVKENIKSRGGEDGRRTGECALLPPPANCLGTFKGNLGEWEEGDKFQIDGFFYTRHDKQASGWRHKREKARGINGISTRHGKEPWAASRNLDENVNS